ncbi:hypothetical protein SERLADRAFT_463507 [Serpula lacrymans var. lacrymans S7.9]|nr:uncharacterized protein SERLADRAFT_463507 [Serpula lacrymans var. lacrymans S7.9]EGO26438.1 hypothetical protein SERLADRAFT_463507 [Serpula lacrymans var. lacrymans S7.9]
MAWIVGEPTYDRFLDSVYTKVRETEAQAVSGRWRALTRAHLQQLQREEPETLETLASSITNGLVDILVTAGCSAPINKIQEKLKTAFNTKIAVMVDLAIRLNRAIGEDITSGNMEVVAVSSAMPYDPAKMDNAYEDGQPQDSASIRVLCPTDLGLQRLSKVSMTGEDEWDTKMLLKPKVAIESVVDSLEDFVTHQ